MSGGIAGEIEALIADYPDYLQDGDYVRRVFELAGAPTSLEVLRGILSSGDHRRVSAAGVFLRDAVLSRYVRGLWELVPRSGVFLALRANLYAPDYRIRGESVYTLGKLTYPREAVALREAFPWYLERDPLELPHLLGELWWLSRKERRRRWEYVLAIAKHPQYLVRWSVFETIETYDHYLARHTREARLSRRLLRVLAQDRHPLICAEARLHLADWRQAKARVRLTRGERRRIWKRRLQEPEHTFGMLSIVFRNYLWVSGRADYDLPLLDRFVQFWLTHPLHETAGEPISHEAYARAFEEWLAERAQ